MSESSPPSESQVLPTPVEDGDVRDLIDAIRTLSSPNGTLQQLAESVKESNEVSREGHKLSRSNQRLIYFMLIGMLIVLIFLAIAAIVFNNLVDKLRALDDSMEATMAKVDTVKSSTEKTGEKVDEVKAQNEAVAEQKATETRVELVPETDPHKALKAPVKVRVVGPIASPKSPKVYPSASSSPSARPLTTIEVPLKDLPSATP